MIIGVLACTGMSLRPSPEFAPTAAMPGVVLVLRENPDGSVGYGAGMLVGPDQVLTNLHVVSNAVHLATMFHDPTRTSYIPDDGGLARYIFENKSHLVPARLVRGDPTLDLALIELESSGTLMLDTASEVVPGQEVYALGHPQETVWSFTRGVVSSLHQGMIQHDAAINRGNSGGPLVNVDGQVVGVNTSKLMGGTDGIGFARPIDLASRLVDDTTLVLDRSDPEGALRSCQAALELALPEAVDCLDWTGVANAFLFVLEQELAELDVETRESVLAQARIELGPEVLSARLSERVVDDPDMVLFASVWGGVALGRGPLALEQGVELREYEAEIDSVLQTRHGLVLDQRNPQAFVEVVKMGTRVEGFHDLDGTSTWLDVRGRNLDGSEYRYSQLMRLQGGGWCLSVTPTDAQIGGLPEGWAPPFSTEEDFRVAAADLTEVTLE